MAEKTKKIDKEFVLSDSSVNCYGFRLMTDGYQMANFAANPIGYKMHARDKGVVLKWDDLRVDGDRVLGKPVINMSHPDGPQLADDVENGFMNAASMGHFTVLDYSDDPELMLHGQTGPTVTKWHNGECSLVDIPGNKNALALYDKDGDPITLSDLAPRPPKGVTVSPINNDSNFSGMNEIKLTLADLAAIEAQTGLKIGAGNEVALHLKTLKSQADLVPGLQAEITALKAVGIKAEVTALLDGAIKEKKVTVQLKDQLAKDYAENPSALKNLLSAMPAYQSIADTIDSNKGNTVDLSTKDWSWDDYQTKDPTGKKLTALKAGNPDAYQALFDAKFYPEGRE